FSSVLHHLPDYMTVLSLALQQLRPEGFLWVCHEPLAFLPGQQEIHKSVARTLIGRADNSYILCRKALIYLAFAVRHRGLPRRIDYSWSDFHAREGIAAHSVLSALEGKGAR